MPTFYNLMKGVFPLSGGGVLDVWPSFRVSEGTRFDEGEEERASTLKRTTTAAHLLQIGRTPMNLQRTMNTDGVPYCEDPQVPRPATYTYISLELGQLWISLTRKRWAHTRHSYHVTIAYLPGMPPPAQAQHPYRLDEHARCMEVVSTSTTNTHQKPGHSLEMACQFHQGKVAI